MSARPPFWSDDFDMDVLRVLPTLPEILGDAGHITLYVHAHSSYGRLNHPNVWNTLHGFIAFFGTTSPPPKPESYYTSDPIVECTFEEAIRDVWVHHMCMTVNRRTVWNSHRWERGFNEVMYMDRGWSALVPGRRDLLLRDLAEDLRQATGRMRALVAAPVSAEARVV